MLYSNSPSKPNPQTIACEALDVDLVEEAFENGANVNFQDCRGFSSSSGDVFSWYLIRFIPPLLSFSLVHKHKSRTKSVDWPHQTNPIIAGWSALHHIADRLHNRAFEEERPARKIFDMLVEKKANFHARTLRGETPLMLAEARGFSHVADSIRGDLMVKCFEREKPPPEEVNQMDHQMERGVLF